MVAEEINDFLKSVNSDERISHQSYRARGILKQPTVHLGNNAWHELRLYFPWHKVRWSVGIGIVTSLLVYAVSLLMLTASGCQGHGIAANCV